MDRPLVRWSKRRLTLRCIPGHIWVSLSPTWKAQPGHSWMYGGIVRRDTFTVRGVGLVVSRMPKRSAPTEGGEQCG